MAYIGLGGTEDRTEVKLIDVYRLVIASLTFVLWGGSVVAYLFYRVPIDPSVFILTAGAFSFLFGPGVFKSVKDVIANGKPKENPDAS